MVSRLKDTLLLVGAADSDRMKLRNIFDSEYDLLEAENADQALLLLEQNRGCIAAVLADIPLKQQDDVRGLAEGCHAGTEDEIPFLLFVTPDRTGRREERAFSLGAADVVLKPYTPSSVRRRLQVLTELFVHKLHLETMVKQQSETIRNTNQVMLDALSAIIEHRSTESGNHVLRIRRFTEILLTDVARSCPEYGLTVENVGIISNAAALHDIGKISIPDAILNKPGKLTAEEYETIKTHTTVGGKLVENLHGMGDEEYLRYAYNIAKHHHERWDGHGYPGGLKGEDIPICAQVVGLADAFDALTTARVYKPALPYEQAFHMILNGECGAFSPKLLECFKHVRRQFEELAERYADGYSPKSDKIAVPLPGPVWKKHQLSTLELSQVKYQTVLHYLNDPVLELDLEANHYHVVYNPDPELDDVIPAAASGKITDAFRQMRIHPDDLSVLRDIQQTVQDSFFWNNLRRKTFTCRIFRPAEQKYRLFDLILLRVNTGNPHQRIVTAIWHKQENEKMSADAHSSVYDSPALYGLVSSALRCYCGSEQTVETGLRELSSLTGYTEQELQEQFGGRLLSLVVEEDRQILVDTVEELMKNGGRAETEYRIVRKNAEPLWILDKSRLYTEEDGQEYIYHALRDNARLRATQEQMQLALERNQLILKQSEGVVFEYDVRADRMFCSKKWRELFGYDYLSENFSEKLSTTSHFHPDDLSVLRKTVRALISGKQSSADMEVRIVTAAGKYLWCKIRAGVRLGADGSVAVVTGIITNIDSVKRATLALKERAERDALTKLLNKESAKQMVTEYLQRQPPEGLSAMLILDMDDFKCINDTYGHLYGDSILSRIGGSLQKMFRANDIIGRIGGDEFMVFMTGLPSEAVVRERCKDLLEMFRELLPSQTPELNTSCSIGAALSPKHGVSYAELFQKADEALYLAKRKGKNRFKVYNVRDKYDERMDGGVHRGTRIDSDEQPSMVDNSFVYFVFKQLYESKDIEGTLDELLAYIGKTLNVSRAYIFENNDDNTACSNTFEWCGENIAPEKDNLQNISYVTDIPGWPDVYDERGVFYCTDVKELAPQFRIILEPQGVKSILQCAIMDGGKFRGYVGFDECTFNRLWTQEQVELLKFLSEVLALFLLKKRSQDKAVQQTDNLLSVLDNQDAWIYVIDPDTYQLKFLNKKARELASVAAPGMVCHKVFMGRDSRCENCPAANIRQEQNGISVIDNGNFGVRVQARASRISWNGQTECLITCHELSKE